ncbi:MAG TPA: proton-conducting transporter membrane subunit [Candidatus Sulfopaludibacter sp.]|nr:proton-conducting transporter membrane subunit [Candidatus Sulfopaludibacter sp.]
MGASGLLLELVFALCFAGALAGIFVPERRSPALLAWFGSLAALLTLWASGNVLGSGQVFQAELWMIHGCGTLTISLDRLSALFLAVAAVVVLASSMFSAGYLKRYAGRYNLKALNAWYLLLFASIVLILIANDVLLFLLAWEAMSILTYLLVNFEHRRDETSRAGYLMLAMGEAGFAAVMLVLLFLAARTGSLDFAAFKTAGANLGGFTRWIIFLLTFFGFGVKAGLVPVNTWLPRAHPAAPANVSAILSGTILNLGLYGIIRVNLDLVPVTQNGMIGAGVVVLVIGTISALVGILYATTENDLKAMLAHSSIENIGIVTAGLGAGMIFTSYSKPALAGIAFIAAFYHMINHSVYKSLLFFGAGTVDDRAGTRDLNKLGGLIHAMPWTAGAFLVGTLEISALPPFNGFVSEWLTLQTMLRSSELPSTLVKLVFALCGAGLALTAALAVTCFVKAFAMGFLGMSRSEEAANAVEAKAPSIAPMILMAALCVLLGVLPTYLIPALSRQLQPWTDSSADTLVPPFFASNPAHNALPPAFVEDFHNLGAQVGQNVLPGRGLVVLHRGGEANPVVFAMSTSYSLVALIVLLLLTYVVIRLWLTRNRKLARRTRWDGGVRNLLPEMTYTATGFSNPVRVVFDAVFRPTTMEDTRETVAQHFRTAIRRERVAVHIVDRLAVQPARDLVMNLAQKLAVMHRGRINAYAAYVLLALLVALLLSPFL